MIERKDCVIQNRVSVYRMSQNNTISSMNPERAYNNVTLKNLTAFQLLSQRENICELLNLVESTERHNSIINPERQRMSLEEMKKMLDALKNERKKQENATFTIVSYKILNVNPASLQMKNFKAYLVHQKSQYLIIIWKLLYASNGHKSRLTL